MRHTYTCLCGVTLAAIDGEELDAEFKLHTLISQLHLAWEHKEMHS
jgi:hypothetical protein